MRESSFQSWQKVLANGFSSAKALLEFLNIPDFSNHSSELAERVFKTRVPIGFAERMEKGNIHDPLLRQVLAIDDELQKNSIYVTDPLLEKTRNALPGLIHKYHNRVLLVVTGACAVNCRYCFRRHFPYAENNPGRQGWQEALRYIESQPQVDEVILSGGDPLLAKDELLFSLIESISQISTVKTVRFHTRIPIVLPERIDSSFVKNLSRISLKKIMVLHSNHPNELNKAVLNACNDLRDSGCVLLNQSVLLAGVNDDADTLVELSHRLFDFGIMPYYLHLLDKVSGAAHFDMPDEKSLSIFKQLQSRVSGYLVPRLVREEAGIAYKTIVV